LNALASYLKSNVEKVYGKALVSNDIVQTREQSKNKNLSLAFFLQIYDKNMEHAPRLLEKIWETDNVYAIHVDAKVDNGKYLEFQEFVYGGNVSYKKFGLGLFHKFIGF